MHISSVERRYCLPGKCQALLEMSGESRPQASLWQFEQEEVGKWNHDHVGVISSFGAATVKKPLLLSFSRVWGK